MRCHLWPLGIDRRIDVDDAPTGRADLFACGAQQCTAVGTTIAFVRIREVPADVTESGGTVVMEKSPISETSWYAFFNDPDGNTIGLYEGATDTSS